MNEAIYAVAQRTKLCEEAIEQLMPVAEKLDGTEELAQLWKKVFEGDNAPDFVEQLADKFGCEHNIFKLAAAVLLTRNMKEEYDRRGYTQEMFTDGLRDIPIWALCTKKETGKWGLKNFAWIHITLGVRLWRLGRLEFELIEYEGKPYEKNGTKVNPGDKVINVHIPEDYPITPAVCDDSFDRAEKFFNLHVFTCHSWMLWPTHEQILPETSNILAFQRRFDVVEPYENNDNGDLWRIFGYLNDYGVDKLPQNTTLQRAYVSAMKANGGKTGGAFGVYVR